ncbi:Iron-sulfur clusters transporter atm1, mitochondrial, partial [Dissophora globulifera]
MIPQGPCAHAVRAPLRKLALALASNSSAAPANHRTFFTASQSSTRPHLSSLLTSTRTAGDAGGLSLFQSVSIRFNRLSEARTTTSRFSSLALNQTQKRAFTRPSAPRFKNEATPEAASKHSSGPGAAAGAGNSSKTLLTQSSTSSSTVTATATKASEKTASSNANAEQNRLDWKIFKDLAMYIWPKNDRGVKIRVVVALSLLVMGKILNVQVPFYFKEIIDKLNMDFPQGAAVMTVVGAAILG